MQQKAQHDWLAAREQLIHQDSDARSFRTAAEIQESIAKLSAELDARQAAKAVQA